ncbi:MAG: AI-2E family transporter [Opitutaceae bacterium]
MPPEDDIGQFASELDSPEESAPVKRPRASAAIIVLAVMAVIAFLYFGRPVMLPLFLASFAAMTVKPVMRGLAYLHLPAPVASFVIIAVVLATAGFSFVRLSHPAIAWINDAPAHLTQLRHRGESLFKSGPRLTEAAAAVTKLVTPETEKGAAPKPAPAAEPAPPIAASSVIEWTGSLLETVVATLVLFYLLLAAGDRPLQKLVSLMPTLREKKRAVDISHEIQRGISDYLFYVTLINVALGVFVWLGLSLIGVPNAAMWGVCAAVLNYIPYFGPYVGIALVTFMGVLSFTTLSKGLLPGGWYLLLHLVESNLVTPILLGRRCLLNPVAIFVSLIFWTWLWGIPGAWIAVPILVAVKVTCERVPSLSAIAALVSH